MILILVGGMGLLIFMMYNSRKKQREALANRKSNLKPGATVMTSSGIYGTVVDVDEEDNKVTVESGPGTLLVLHVQALGQVTAPEGESDDDEVEGAVPPSPEVADAESRATNGDVVAEDAAEKEKTEAAEDTPEADEIVVEKTADDAVAPADDAAESSSDEKK